MSSNDDTSAIVCLCLSACVHARARARVTRASGVLSARVNVLLPLEAVHLSSFSLLSMATCSSPQFPFRDSLRFDVTSRRETLSPGKHAGRDDSHKGQGVGNFFSRVTLRATTPPAIPPPRPAKALFRLVRLISSPHLTVNDIRRTLTRRTPSRGVEKVGGWEGAGRGTEARSLKPPMYSHASPSFLPPSLCRSPIFLHFLHTHARAHTRREDKQRELDLHLRIHPSE